MHVHRRAAAGAGSLAVAGALLVSALGAGPVSADPGSCGVRSGGPYSGGTFPSIEYVVRNRCQTTYSFRVVLPTYGKKTSCASIAPSGYHTFTYPASDGNWYVEVC
jgi:hypothetical protein